MIRLTPAAESALRPGEVVLVDWHVLALCCAAAGEVSVRPMPRARVGRRYRTVAAEPAGAVVVHERAYVHLARLDVTVDCRTRFGVRSFSTDLPADFGLRASLGRLPGPGRAGTDAAGPGPVGPDRATADTAGSDPGGGTA